MIERPSHIPKHMHDAAARYWSRQQSGDHGIDHELTQWLEGDQRHRIAFEALKRDWHDSERLIEVPLGQSRKLSRAPLYMRHSAQVAFAGIAGLVLLGAATVWFVRPGSSLSPVTVARAASFSSEVGEIRHITLADRTELTLDTNSQVSVNPKGRNLQLEVGQGRVRVRPGQRTQIMLKSAGAAYRISAHGKFDITVKPAASVTAIVGPLRLSDEKRQIEISPGERVAVEDMDEARQNVTALEMEWTSGMAVLQATPVSTAVNAINRYNRTQILIDSPELERKRMTGAFDVRDPLSFARAVAKLFGATVKPAPSGEVHLGL